MKNFKEKEVKDLANFTGGQTEAWSVSNETKIDPNTGTITSHFDIKWTSKK
jgi:hypothetical protein